MKVYLIFDMLEGNSTRSGPVDAEEAKKQIARIDPRKGIFLTGAGETWINTRHLIRVYLKPVDEA